MAASGFAFVQDLAIVMIAAALVTIAFHRLRLPSVLGYVLAGALVGPYFLPSPLVTDAQTIRTLAELGIVFLMFSVGMEFNLREVRKVGPLIVLAGALEVALTLWLGYEMGGLLGWGTADRIFLGAIVSISSTTIIAKFILDRADRDAAYARAVFGILIVEDVAAVAILTFLSSVGVSGQVTAAGLGLGFVHVLFGTIVFVGVVLALGLLIVPRLVDGVARLHSDETLVVSILGLLFGASLLAALFGFSTALGAFLIGALVSEARAHARIGDRIEGMRDMFIAVFFVSVGMLLDPAILVVYWPAVILIAGTVVLGKLAAASLGAFAAGYEGATALKIGASLAVIGEFGFVFADLGERLGVTSPFLVPVVVAASALTTLVNPPLTKDSERLANNLRRLFPPVLRTYSRLYSAWVRGLRNEEAAPGRLSVARHEAAHAMLHLAGAVGIIVAGRLASSFIAGLLATDPAEVVRMEVIVWFLVGVFAIPFAVGFVRRFGAFTNEIADAAIPGKSQPGDSGTRPAAVRVVSATLRLIAAIVLSVGIVLAVSPFLPSLPVALIVLGGLGVMAWFLWENLLRVNRHIEESMEAVLHGEPADARERAEIRGLIEQMYPFSAEAARVTLPGRSPMAGLTLKQSALRNRTGASIASVERRDEHFVNPEPNLILEPGDVVTLLGEHTQVEAARRLIKGEDMPTPGSGPQFASVEVTPDSPLVGETLATARLRERMGGTVVCIVRNGRRINNPPPETRLVKGDVLILLAGAQEPGAAGEEKPE